MAKCAIKAAIATPLPYIIRDLDGTEFEWVGSAYALAATAFQPLCGGFAQVSFFYSSQQFYSATILKPCRKRLLVDESL